jgi:predicted nucleotide-binding protein
MSEEKNKLQEMLFLQLILMFQTAALQQMGKLANPLTQKVEKDLEQAKLSIDILGMLEEKTKGNLSEEEKKFLDHVLFELRMNYLEELKKAEGSPEGVKKKPSESEEEKKE